MNDAVNETPIVVEPYRVADLWVFDYPPAAMVARPFAEGVQEMLDLVLERKDLSGASGFRLTFADTPFVDWDGRLLLVDDEAGAPRYRLEGVGDEPSGRFFFLDAFFSETPANLYFRIESLKP